HLGAKVTSSNARSSGSCTAAKSAPVGAPDVFVWKIRCTTLVPCHNVFPLNGSPAKARPLAPSPPCGGAMNELRMWQLVSSSATQLPGLSAPSPLIHNVVPLQSSPSGKNVIPFGPGTAGFPGFAAAMSHDDRIAPLAGLMR